MSYFFQNYEQHLRKPILAALLVFSPFFLLSQQRFNQTSINTILKKSQRSLGITADDYADIEIIGQYADDHNGLTHVYLQQKHNGIKLSGAILGLHFNTSGELVHSGNRFFPDKKRNIRPLNVNISQEQALAKVCEELDLTYSSTKVIERVAGPSRKIVFEKGNISLWDIPVELVYQINERQLTPAWEVQIYQTDEQHYWLYKVDVSTGKILDRSDWVQTCQFHAHEESGHSAEHHQHYLPEVPTLFSEFTQEEQLPVVNNFYRVYDSPVEAPNFGERILVSTVGDLGASPLGWHNDGILSYPITKGNNVYAYVDLSPIGQVGYTYGVGLPAVGGLPGEDGPLVFDFPVNFDDNPQLYQSAAVTNLFYWNNLIHDVFYNYGFTEQAGNFQWNNFLNGGAGNDPVLAEAQDPSLVDNANFFTPPDGLPARMQMYLWTTNIPLIDGDFDNGVIVHEYGHGISTRLTGGPAATCLSGSDEQGGEGWSDFFGLLMTMKPGEIEDAFSSGRGIGTYVLNEPSDGLGIRPAKYSTSFAVNGYTFADVTNAEISVPHGVGFIWCTMLWEMTHNLIEAYGYDPDIAYGGGGNNIAMQLVVDGLKLQPCSPTFIDQRDAILAADMINYGGANQCLIWEAFAKRGLGYSASSGSTALGDEVEAFDLPPSFCQPVLNIETTIDPLVTDNQQAQVLIQLTNNSNQLIQDVTVTDQLPTGTSFAASSHGGQMVGNTLNIYNVAVAPNSVETITVTLNVNTGSQAQLLFRDDMEQDPFNWTTNVGLDQFSWTNQEAFAGSYSWFAADPNNFSNQTLTLNEGIEVTNGTHLRFAHRYNTELGFDGGVIEASADAGSTWSDIGNLIVENGYNDFVTAANNPLLGGFAFGGDSHGYLHSLADLSSFAGETIQVRFRFSSDVLTGQEGWFVDDVELVNNPTIITNTAAFSMANGFVTGQHTAKSLVLQAGSQALAGALPDNGIEANNNSLNTDLSLNIQPNPASDIANILVHSVEEGSGMLEVRNLQGEKVYLLEANLAKGQNNTVINISNWAAGMYIVSVSSKGMLVSQKLVIH